MRWEGRQQSDNIEDRKGMPAGGKMAVGGGLGTLVLVVVVMLLGGDPRQLLENIEQQAGPGAGQVSEDSEPLDAAQQEVRAFVGVVFKDTEDVWEKLLPTIGKRYDKPHMVVFQRAVDSGCGTATAAAGPFYCPADQKVYIDLTFFEELQTKLQARGDFAMAYVVAHEVGHHVQQLLGLSDQVHRLQAQSSRSEANQLSVRLELQADFLAGVWAHHADKMKNILETGDREEALNAASRIGDDVLQKQATGRVNQEGFTHGSAKQRVNWLRKGLISGDLKQMDQLFKLDFDSL